MRLWTEIEQEIKEKMLAGRTLARVDRIQIESLIRGHMEALAHANSLLDRIAPTYDTEESK